VGQSGVGVERIFVSALKKNLPPALMPLEWFFFQVFEQSGLFVEYIYIYTYSGGSWLGPQDDRTPY